MGLMFISDGNIMTKQTMKILSLLTCVGLLLFATTSARSSDSKATPEVTAAVVDNPYADIPFSRTVDGAPVLGDPDAPITIVEFADFACPPCQRYQPTME